ncbi:MAG: DNA polymerase III subunit delta [Verrucomicrobiia bacterium]
MASARSQKTDAVILVCGEDEFAVKQRSRQLFQDWSKGSESLDQEIIDASVNNSGEALQALAKLREALQTLPFFSAGKVVWLKDCTFLGDERAATTQAVTENLAELAQELKAFSWDKVRLLVSAGKVDKRKVFYKALEKIGTVETLDGWSVEDRDWAARAEDASRRLLKGSKKEISSEALAKLVASVGPNSRQLHSEIEKLVTYVGGRSSVDLKDVETIVTHNKQSRAFALGDALGERDLQRALQTLDDELWEMKRNRQKNEIGLLYGLISKVRVMIFLKEMVREGWLKFTPDYSRFRTQLEQIPAAELPTDRRFNPLAMNPYVLFRALAHSKQYTLEELSTAMALLLECNRCLVLSSLESASVLQQTLIKIIGRTGESRVI